MSGSEDSQNDGIEKIISRLHDLTPTLSFIRTTTGTPSFSVGVAHNGKTIFTHSEGVHDFDASEPRQVNVDTAYLLGSLTKGFISASCGILVDEGKLEWTKPLRHYVPFEQKSDPVISERASLLDALSHSTGFPQIDISWYGAQGESIIPPGELMHIVNNIPVFPDFRAKFHYSNWMYALVGHIIETVVGKDGTCGWAGFVQDRIFRPLGMDRSRTNRRNLPDGNFAEPHTVLDNRTPARLAVPNFSDETITGAAAAIWSTVPDMLKWTTAVLDRLEHENKGQNRSPTDNPLRGISTILAHQFHVTHTTVNENSYGLGWARHLIPSKHLGWLSINGPQPDHVLGQDSRPRLILYHGGQITGYLNTVYMAPETQSVIVVLTNAQGAGDCSDWIAQAILQDLFDLQPRLDFHKIVEESATKHFGLYQTMKNDYEAKADRDSPVPKCADIVGTYHNDSILMTIDVSETDGDLVMQLNGKKSQRHTLSHFKDDTFGFLPRSREEMELRCLVDYDSYEQFLICFHRDQSNGRANSITWRMQSDFPALAFSRAG